MLNVQHWIHPLRHSSWMQCLSQCNLTDFLCPLPKELCFKFSSVILLWLNLNDKAEEAAYISLVCSLSYNTLMQSTVRELLLFIPLLMTATVLHKIVGASNIVMEFEPHCSVVDLPETQNYSSFDCLLRHLLEVTLFFLPLSFLFCGPGLWIMWQQDTAPLWTCVYVLVSVMRGYESLPHFWRKA